jgi:hypothetical protein
MSDEHRTDVPSAIEQVVTGLSELAAALGSAGDAMVPAIRQDLLRAMAARDRGDPKQAVEHIAAAMGRLAKVVENLDPEEAALMRSVLERFRSALICSDQAGVKGLAEIMFERSGARVKRS